MLDTAHETEPKQAADGEREGNCFGKRTMNSPLRRSRRRSSKSFDAMDVLQSNGNARSPRYIWYCIQISLLCLLSLFLYARGAGGSTPYPVSKPVLDSAEVDSGRGPAKGTAYGNRSTNKSAVLKDFNASSDSFLETDTLINERESNPFRGPGMQRTSDPCSTSVLVPGSSKRNSFHRERPGGVGSPVPTRETRSAESSGVSGGVENPERRPC